MTKEELIKQCRYYKGEEENSFEFEMGLSSNEADTLGYFWGKEKQYVDSAGWLNDADANYYKATGGKDYSGIPFPLLILFFHFWGKSVHGIKENLHLFYRQMDHYLFISNDHYPEDIIPS